MSAKTACATLAISTCVDPCPQVYLIASIDLNICRNTPHDLLEVRTRRALVLAKPWINLWTIHIDTRGNKKPKFDQFLTLNTSDFYGCWL